MTRRKQNLILFFRENEEPNVISSRLVRLYMNRFTIDEGDETEVAQVYNVKNGTWKEYEECFSKSLIIARKSETPETDYHFIIGYSTVNDDKKSWYAKMWSFFHWSQTKSLIFKISQLIVNNQSRLENYFAVTLLHGSNSLQLLSEFDEETAYQYQKKEDKYEQKRFWRKIFPDMNFVTERFVRSINDDLEWFRRRILDYGINSTILNNERIQSFHYQIQDDNQVMDKTDSNDYYVRFNCIRVTMYSNNGTMKKYFFLLMEILLYQLELFYVIYSVFSTTIDSVLLTMILMFLMFYDNYRSNFNFFSIEGLGFIHLISVMFLWLAVIAKGLYPVEERTFENRSSFFE